AFAGGFGYLTGAALPRGEAQAKQILERLLHPDPKTSARQAPAFARLLAQSNLARGVHLLVLRGSFDAATRQILSGFEGASVRCEFESDRLVVEAYIATSPGTTAMLRKIFPSGPAQPGLAGYLAPDTVLAAAGRLDIKALFDALLGMSPPVQK